MTMKTEKRLRPTTARVAILVGTLLHATAVASAQCELARFTARDGRPGDNLGSSVALSGQRALVGARSADNIEGAAYVFDTESGELLWKLKGGSGWFGKSVALDGRRAIVGAPFADGLVDDAGSASVIDIHTGAELFELSAADGIPFSYFGDDVAIHGDRAIIGCPLDDATAHWSGSAYLYDVTTGALLFKITAESGQASDIFGATVGIYGNRAIVGAWGDDELGNVAGAAYLFDVDTGQQLMKWVASDGEEGDKFGESVAISGNRALVGAWGDDDHGPNSGSAYIFDVSSGRELHKLAAPDGATWDTFGAGVSISGNLAIVGAGGDDDVGADSGGAYVFDVTTGRFLYKLTASQGLPNGSFANAENMAVAGTRAIVGATGEEDWAGAAYLFQIPDFALPYCFGDGCPCSNDHAVRGCINSTGRGAHLSACRSASVAADDLVLRAAGLPAHVPVVFVMGAGQARVPFQDGLLCSGPGALGVFRFAPRNADGTGALDLGPGIAARTRTEFKPTGHIDAGETWNFQAWYRDLDGPCGYAANLTNAVAITFEP